MRLVAVYGVAILIVLGTVTGPARGEESPPPETPPAAAEPVGGGKGISIGSPSGEFTLRLGFWGQTRFQLFDRDQYRRTDRVTFTPPIPIENIGQTEKTFDLPHLRLWLRGHAFRPWLTYKMELDLVANDEGLREVFIPPVDPITGSNAVLVRAGAESLDGRTLKLVDYYLDGLPIRAAGFRVGQFKIPQGRQELVSDTRLQMTSRSIASDFFAPGRDRGITFYGSTPEGRIGYALGAYNGGGLGLKTNTDKDLAYNLRLTATSTGAYLDTESVIDDPERFHAQGGVSWYGSRQRTTQTSDPVSLLGVIEDRRVAADLEFFWKRANLMMEYHQGRIQLDDSIQQRMEFICFGAYLQGLSTCDQQGYHVQGGVLIGRHHELSARRAMVDSDRDLSRDREYETTLSYTYFFSGHALRWSTSLSALTLQVNGPGSSGLDVQRGDSSIPTVPNFPNPEGFPGLDDDHDRRLATQLQWAF